MRIVLTMTLAGALFSAATTASLADVTFGAIAYSTRTGVTTFALSTVNHQISDRDALRRCMQRADDCVLAVWVKGGCAAVAGGAGGRYGYAFGQSRSSVRRIALWRCRTTTDSCVVTKSICTDSWW